MEDAVADGVGDGGVAEVVVPLGGRELAGDDRGAVAVAILEDLEQVAPLLVLWDGEAPVVEDEDVEAGESGEQSAVCARRVGQDEFLEEASSSDYCGVTASKACPRDGGTFNQSICETAVAGASCSNGDRTALATAATCLSSAPSCQPGNGAFANAELTCLGLVDGGQGTVAVGCLTAINAAAP